MKLQQISSNCCVIRKDNGIAILVSYETAVAVEHPKRGIIRTAANYSRTTSKHINAWIAGRGFNIVPQADIDKLI